MSPNLEWSGILFYSIAGTFEDSNLEMTCKDILVLDQGSSGETEIDMNTTEVAAYLAQNTELLDCYQGLIHSHHKMETFFSGTDQSTLLQEGTNRNNFLSLIVNNRGKYTAGITRKTTKTITNVVDSKVEKSYQFFDKYEVSSPTKENKYEEKKVETTIEWCNCNIQKEQVEDIDSVVSQFQKIRSKKETEREVQVSKLPASEWWNRQNTSNTTKAEKELTLFNAYGNPTFANEDEELWDSNKKDWKATIDAIEVDESVLNKICCKILSGTPLSQKADLKSLAPIYDALVKKSFSSKAGSFYELNYGSWLSSWIEYIVTEDEDFADLAYNLEYGDDECTSIIVTKICTLLEILLPKSNSKELLLSELNKYVDMI